MPTESMQSQFLHATRSELAGLCHDSFIAKAAAIRSGKLAALKCISSRIRAGQGVLRDLREEWIQLYTSLCRYNVIDTSTFPSTNKLSLVEWNRIQGHETTKILAREHQLHDDLLPLEFTPVCNVDAQFKRGQGTFTMGRGNIILPEEMASPPAVAIKCDSSSSSKQFTLAFIDLDRPSLDTGRRTQYCHWLRTSITRTDPTGASVLKYEPPSPERGSGVHRYALLVIGHQQPAAIDGLVREHFDLCQFASKTSGTIDGLLFIRSFWTKQTPQGTPPRIYGEVQEIHRGPPMCKHSIH